MLGQSASLAVAQTPVQEPQSLEPSFCWYSHSVMAEPPSPLEVHVSVTCPSPASTAGLPGAGGTAAGVTGSDSGDAALLPLEFTARTLKR